MRNMHAVGASMFFLAVYIHIARGLYYGSYKAPREVLWIIGVVILLLMMATAFMGYSLPWGQMSFWAVTVITNLFSSLDSIIPGLGTSDRAVAVGRLLGVGRHAHPLLQPALPAALRDRRRRSACTSGRCTWSARTTPPGSTSRRRRIRCRCARYAVMKDAFALSVFVILFAWFVFYLPDYLGHPDNYVEANPLSTPPHIVPEWYFLPYYAILRAIPNKLLGVIAMFSSILILLFVPWLDTSRVRSAKYRPIYKWFFWLFVFSVRGARLSRLQAAGGHLRVLGAHLHGLLLRSTSW